MSQYICSTDDSVTLLGGGPCHKAVFDAALLAAPYLVAADGGADRALKLGHVPQAVIGDMDSLSAEARAQIPPDRLHPIAEQDSTDFDKALRSIDAPLVLGVGFLGRRLDHTLAAMSVLATRTSPPCILLSRKDAVFACPPRLALDLPLGSRFSLYPMGAVTGRSTGLRWPIDGLAMAPMGQIGTSNEVTGPVRLEMDGPGMIVITPRAALGSILQAVAPDARATR